MPHGRHRHSPPLHRLLPPTAIAVVAVLGAGASWFSGQALVLRALVFLVAVAALTGAVVMRRWDSVAGLRVAELDRARGADEWRHEERVAELEAELEESREQRGELARKVRAKRAELSALRNEHAALLRRYAAAETARANALEGRRRLAIEAASPARALPPAGADRRPDPRPSVPRGTRPTPELYGRANEALNALAHRAAQARTAAQDATASPVPAEHTSAPLAAAPARRRIAAASAFGPAPAPRRPVPRGSFDFFGTHRAAEPARHPAEVPAAVREAVQHADLADVVGEEAAEAAATEEVIDLTAHDETEQLDVGSLRQAMGA
ncbi:hypothetical protein ABZV64_14230 [Streptomyces sp. NPDC004959]|uniref:hypothetical protein n=1 Tax=unclassified Streptomyces TaxID=2593676 RepID=UPI0004C810EB|nr:hypothetical protein [Streptomyces sp. NRRL F-5630]